MWFTVIVVTLLIVLVITMITYTETNKEVEYYKHLSEELKKDWFNEKQYRNHYRIGLMRVTYSENHGEAIELAKDYHDTKPPIF